MKPAIGQNLPRIDGRAKVTGKARYASDISLPGTLYAKVLRSPLPHASIRHIDSRKASSLGGVRAVLTGGNLPVTSPYIGALLKDQPIIAVEKVRYSGDIVAAVAATDEAIAQEALHLIEVDYEELPAVVTIEEAIQPEAPLVHEVIRRTRTPEYGRGSTYILHENSNICHHFHFEKGDIERGFQESDFVFEDTFDFPSAHHASMEPHTSMANFEGDQLTIWSSTQSPFRVRQDSAELFGIPLSRVRVIVPYVGGGYGGPKSQLNSLIAAALSRVSGRPVTLTFGGDEGFKTACQPQGTITIRTGVKKDGTFVARRSEVYLNAGAYLSNTSSITERAGYRSQGPYRFKYFLADAHSVYTNTVPASAFRAFGGPHAAFAYESHMDVIAYRLKMDPLELRMKNLLDRGEEWAPGETPIDCNLKGALKEVADAIDWGQREKGPAAPWLKRGKGLACGVKDGGGHVKPANAMVKLFPDGSVLLFSASVEIGQGARTALLQIAAEELSMPRKGCRWRKSTRTILLTTMEPTRAAPPPSWGGPCSRQPGRFANSSFRQPLP